MNPQAPEPLRKDMKEAKVGARGPIAFLLRLPTTTTEGRFYLAGLVAFGFLATATDRNFVLLLLGILLSAIPVSVLFSALNLRSIRFQRELPDAVEAGELFTVRIRVENRRRWLPARGVLLKDALQSTLGGVESRCYAPVIPAGGHVTFVYEARIRRRGAYNITNALLTTRFPFGLFEKRSLARFPTRIVVYPSMAEVSGGQLLGSRESAVSTADRTRREAGGVEFHSLRDYRPGDNPKRIAWRVSARRGRLVLKEMEQEDRGQVAVVLATSLRGVPALQRRSALETAVSLSASVVRHFRRERRQVLFAMRGYAEEVHLSRGALHRCLERLSVTRSDSRSTPEAVIDEIGSQRLAGMDVLLITPGRESRDLRRRRGLRIRVISIVRGDARRIFRRRG